MALSDYPKEELDHLLFAVENEKRLAVRLDASGAYTELNKWSDRINEAINDLDYEVKRLIENTSVDTLKEIANNL
jgi:hypothetical protein